jgi:surfeit locus 1 family protein
MMLRQMLNGRWLGATLLVLAGTALCIRLGIWQLDRLDQRRATTAHYVQMQAAPPLRLPGDAGQDLTSMEYHAVTATGRYDFSQQVALRNQAYHDEYGYHLLTPLVLDDGAAVLVDRGWIPAEGNDSPAAWSTYDEVPEAGVSGIIRLSRAKAEVGGETDPPLPPGQTRLDTWFFPDIPRIQQQVSYRLIPVYIQLNEDQSDVQPPVPDQPDVDLTEGPHQSYAIQWFSFAAILFIGYPFYIRRHAREKYLEPSHSEEA